MPFLSPRKQSNTAGKKSLSRSWSQTSNEYQHCQESFSVALVSSCSHSHCRPSQSSSFKNSLPNSHLHLSLNWHCLFTLQGKKKAPLVSLHFQMHMCFCIPSSFFLDSFALGTSPCASGLISPPSQVPDTISITPSLSQLDPSQQLLNLLKSLLFTK